MFWSLGEVSLGEFPTSSTADNGCVGFLFGSLGEFSLGEFCVPVIPPIPPIPPILVGGFGALPRRKPPSDEEILAIILSQHLGQTFWKNDKN